MNTLLKIHEADNVAVAAAEGLGVPVGHKIALCDIPCGGYVIKYGSVIGRARCDIKKGEWVHSHNLSSHLDEEETYTYTPNICEVTVTPRTFMGYKRRWGRAGVRNEIYILPTVGCVNPICRRLEKLAEPLVKGSIDGIFALPHPFGCSQLGEDAENIKRLLASIALHPNATFVLLVGLGCENNTMEGMKEILAPYGRDNIAYLVAQKCEDEMEEGMKILTDFAERASQLSREPVDFSELVIGLKCGGSDAFSGLTANPLVGRLADRVVSHGGGAILTEVPEMFGAERELMNRSLTADIFESYKKMILDFKDYYIAQGFPVYENPSPGNKEGGITTLEEKSLGCIKKGGSTPVVDVLGYGELVRRGGLSVLNAPGNDLIAATALAASGAQLVLFTTGRGTPFSTFTPTLKISSGHRLAEYKRAWIDFDASEMDEEGLFRLVLDTAEGRYLAKSEDCHEIAFYKKGVTL